MFCSALGCANGFIKISFIARNQILLYPYAKLTTASAGKTISMSNDITQLLLDWSNGEATSPYYAECLSLLGECLIKVKRNSEAQPLLQEGYEIALKAVGENHPITREARQRITDNQF